MTRIVWPRRSRAAVPRRAGNSISMPVSPGSWRAPEAEIGEAGIERRRHPPYCPVLAGGDHRGVVGAARHLARGVAPALHVNGAGILAEVEQRAPGENERDQDEK